MAKKPSYINKGESMYDPAVRGRIDTMFENMQSQIERQLACINRLLAALFASRAALEAIADADEPLTVDEMRAQAREAIALQDAANPSAASTPDTED